MYYISDLIYGMLFTFNLEYHFAKNDRIKMPYFLMAILF